MRVGLAWSDSSRMSSSHGSFFARIWLAICSMILLGLTWYGSSVMTMLVLSFTNTPRARTLPLPVSYIACRSVAGVMISAAVG